MHRELDSDGSPDDVDAVLADYMRRVDRGERVDQQSLIAAHPEHAAALREYFSQAVAVERFGEVTTADFTAQMTPRNALAIRCPLCHVPAELAVDSPLTDLTCTSCGGVFSLINESDVSRQAPPLARMGRFELVARLGMGGFGSVWKARDKELDRLVAVKIPRRGGMTADEQEKFFREARAAAQLRHPNIVSVHEVGRDGDSVYIVSDFVRGVTLGDWLTGQQLTSREAAGLCAKIADALQHAHEHGVVHRDLKPANIIIDGDGQPHLMDFGLARRDVGEVTVTMEGQVLGTPAYMSPEQAQGESHTADRRSDIYSLGVILFQLLTGELPFRGNARMIMHQVIHDEPPSPRKLNSNVPKDLETITLKCLEKEPARRYQTASELSDEFRHFVAGEPIRARPISRVARTWRWSKRRPAAAALLALLVFVAAGSAAAFLRERDLRREVVTQKNEAESERASAEAVVSFLTDDVLGKASPHDVPDKAVRDTIVKTLLEPAAATVGQRFADNPRVEAAVRHTLASTLMDLGRFDLALAHAERALEQRRKALGQDHPATIGSLNDYAYVLDQLGRSEDAEPLYKQALAQRRKLLGDDDPATLISLNNYAAVLEAVGRSKEAEPLYKQALERRRKVQGEDHPSTMQALNNYAFVLEFLGRAQEAEPLMKQALEWHRKVQGEDHLSTIGALNNYAYMLDSLGRTREAEPLYKQAMEQRRKVLGEDHPQTLSSLSDYALALNSLGRAHEAEPLLKQVLEVCRRTRGPDHFQTISALNDYAHVVESLGRAEEAESLFKQALEQSRKVLGEDYPETISTLDSYAQVLVTLDRAREAEPLSKQALEQSRTVLGEDHPYTVNSLSNYGEVLQSLGRAQEAEPLLKQALEQRRKMQGENHPDTIDAVNSYAGVLKALDRGQEAELLIKQSFPEWIDPPITDLRAAVGEHKTVEFRVLAVGENQLRDLSSKIDRENLDCFTAVVEPAEITVFDTLFRTPKQELVGKTIRVTGTIEEREGRLVIRVSDVATQLAIVDAPEKPGEE